MNNLTLVIPAKFEATTLPVVLKEIKELNLNCKKIVVVPKYDEETLKVLENTEGARTTPRPNVPNWYDVYTKSREIFKDIDKGFLALNRGFTTKTTKPAGTY